MSWQAYIDQQLMGSGCMQQAAIIGLDGNIWAKSPKFAFKAGEGQKLVNNFKDPSVPLGSGVFYNGVKYMCLRADATDVYGKKGNSGIVTMKTKSAVIIGVYDETVQPGQCTNAVARLADYLREQGY